jgi:hypothetical protein
MNGAENRVGTEKRQRHIECADQCRGKGAGNGRLDRPAKKEIGAEFGS